MSPYEIGLISRLSSSACDTSARPPHATAQLPDGHIPRQPPNASQSAELRAAPSASATEAVVVCRAGEPFTLVAQASFRAPFRVEMRVAGQLLGYTQYFYSPGEINLHWFQGWHLGQGRFAPFTCDPALPRDADAELEARLNCSAGTAQLKVSPRKSRGHWLQSRALGVKESAASLGSRRKAAGGTRVLPTGGRCGIAGAHGGDAGKRSGRRHAVASAWWCCSGAHSPALRMTALTTAARGGIERRGKLHWQGGQRAPQPQQQQQWRGNEKQGNEKQGNGEQAAGEVVRAEQEWGELDGCGWRDERAGLPIPSALALSFDPCSNAPDTSSNDGTDSLSSPPSSPPSSPFHPRHASTGAAERAEADGELGAVGGECSAGEKQAGAACRLQCLPASFSHPCALSPLTQPALHLHALHDAAAASHGSTDDEDGDKSSFAPHEDAARSSDSGSNLPPVLPSDVPAAPPPASPVVVDFRVDVLFQSIRLLPCTARPPHVTAAGPPTTTAQCEYCEKRLRWYLGEGGSGQAAPAAVEGAGGARGEETGGAGGVGAAGGGGGGGGGMSALDVPGPVPFHYEDLDEQAYRIYCADIARWLPEGGARGGGAVAGKKQRRVAEAVASAEGAIRGEGRRRREGPATDHFEASLRYYHTALSSPALSPAARLSVLFDMGEVYLGLGDAQLADGKRAAGGPMTADSCRLAFEAFDEICRAGPTLRSADSAGGALSATDVSSGGGGRGGRGRGGGEGGGDADVAEMVQGAAVNAANALVAWAEAVGEVEEGGEEEVKEEERGEGACEGVAVDGGEQQQAQARHEQEQAEQGGVRAVRVVQLLREAAVQYDAAAGAAPNDTDLLSNLGDCAVKTAELMCPERPVGERAVTAWGGAWGQYERGMGAYGAACSLCDARVGDDMPGLLHNWGVGLLSAAQRCPEPDQEVRLLTEAAEKLQRAADFQPTDIASRLALGEVLSAQGEVLSARRAQSASSSSSLQEALHLLSLSLSRGFSAALRIDSRHPEALLGAADVHLSAARLLMGWTAGRERGGGGGRREGGGEGMGGGDEVAASLPQEAVDHLQHAMSAYRAAMVAMKATDVMSYADQCGVLYNMACAAALAGLLAESADILARLAVIGWLSKGDLLSDEDFRLLRQSPVYTGLLSELTMQESL
ncbi:unnamed protein product [Closterium sp. Naga37s-1]|nr:unnamed protein product [Closterium sp. Naga37s-1]